MNQLPPADIPPQPLRRAHLSNYLRDLINDVQAQGKIAKVVGNPVEVAAVALMSGSIAVIQTMWEDIAALTSNAKTNARQNARPALESAAALGVRLMIDKLLGGHK